MIPKRIPASAIFLCLVFPATAQQQPDDRWNVIAHDRIVESGNVLPDAPVLIKSLGDAAEFLTRWTPPASAAEWRCRRPAKEAGFREAIGLETLPERSPLHARILARHDLGDYTIENLIFESRPGFPVTANLYRAEPATSGRRAAVLCPIGHYLSAGKAASDVQARCIKLARMGFVVLVYDAIGQGERLAPGNIHHDAGYALLPLGETIAGWMVWDSMRAIDYLVTLDDVDPHRIGVTGNSGGGLNTLFTAALDARVRAAAVVGFTFEFGNWLKYAGTHCTCTHLPGVFRAMEWFEIAGLIAPRALLMLQGTHDGIFPISGARRAAADAGRIYELLDHPAQVRFTELAGQPHAYSQPYREQMYGWMAQQLLGQGDGGPIAEGDVRPLDETDPRLRCDPGKTTLRGTPTVVDLARKQAATAIAKLPSEGASQWIRDLTAPPDALSHFLAPRVHERIQVPGGRLEKISFVSEDGQSIPGLLWLPEHTGAPARTVIIADARGKAAAAESGLVPPLLRTGIAILAVDLRGRGESLSYYQPGVWNTNFRLLANQILFGRPLAGRRAFDMLRAVDYLSSRKDLSSGDVTVVGIGDDSLPALLASAADRRIRRTAVAGYFHSFVSQMRPRAPKPGTSLDESWNDPQLIGQIDTGGYTVDFGSVIPAVLKAVDVPDIAALIAPRPVLFCQALDNATDDAEVLRFRRVTTSAGKTWIRYEPGKPLTSALLLEWLLGQEKR
jgi:cephalosporin-C deacetylase-like acetyl esterase